MIENVENSLVCQKTLKQFSHALDASYFSYDSSTKECKLFNSDERVCTGLSGPNGNLTRLCFESLENNVKPEWLKIFNIIIFCANGFAILILIGLFVRSNREEINDKKKVASGITCFLWLSGHMIFSAMVLWVLH